MTVMDTESAWGGQPNRGEWLDLRTAQLRLGVGERTVRRRAADGTLKRRTRMDGRLEVWVPLTGGPPETDSESAPDGQAVQAERALVIVDRFNLAVNQQVAPLLERIDGLLDRLDSRELVIRKQAEELGKLRQQVDDFQRRLSETDIKSAPDGQPAAPWWRRWFAL